MTTPEAINFALSYPYERPKDDFIYINGNSYKLSNRSGTGIKDWEVKTGKGITPIRDLVANAAYQFDFTRLIPVVAVGSNGSPVQLRRKFHHLHDTLIPTLMMSLENWAATYCRFISGYGAIPATITRHEGCRSCLPVNFVDEKTFEILNDSEGLGEYYNLQKIETRDVLHPEFHDFKDIFAYKCLDQDFDIRLNGFDIKDCGLPTMTQWEIQQYVIDSIELDMDVISFIVSNIEDPSRRELITEKMKQI